MKNEECLTKCNYDCYIRLALGLMLTTLYSVMRKEKETSSINDKDDRFSALASAINAAYSAVLDEEVEQESFSNIEKLVYTMTKNLIEVYTAKEYKDLTTCTNCEAKSQEKIEEMFDIINECHLRIEQLYSNNL